MLLYPRQAVQLAMDRKDRERELTSALLAALSPQTISEDQMSLGFTRLLASVEVGVAQALRRVASRLTPKSVMMRQVEGSITAHVQWTAQLFGHGLAAAPSRLLSS